MAFCGGYFLELWIGYISQLKNHFFSRGLTWMDFGWIKAVKKDNKWGKISAVSIHAITHNFFCQFYIMGIFHMMPVLPDKWRLESLVSLGRFVCLSSVSQYIFLKISQGAQNRSWPS